MSEEVKQYTLEELREELNEKQRIFCHSYIIAWNKTKSYKTAYGEMDDNSAAVSAHNLLRNTKIEQYINFINNVDNLEKEAGITKLRNLLELTKIAYTSIASLHNTWITLHEFESLTDDQKSAIESIETKTVTINFDETTKEVEYVKLKLFSKQAAIESINKMLGYNLPEKRELKLETEIKTVIKWGDKEIEI
jgi:hypothetical protein